jgi:hypothetical protein
VVQSAGKSNTGRCQPIVAAVSQIVRLPDLNLSVTAEFHAKRVNELQQTRIEYRPAAKPLPAHGGHAEHEPPKPTRHCCQQEHRHHSRPVPIACRGDRLRFGKIIQEGPPSVRGARWLFFDRKGLIAACAHRVREREGVEPGSLHAGVFARRPFSRQTLGWFPQRGFSRRLG